MSNLLRLAEAESMVRDSAEVLEQRALGVLTFLPGEEFSAEVLAQIGFEVDATGISVACTAEMVRRIAAGLERVDGDDAREAFAQVQLDYEQVAADVRAWSRWEFGKLGEGFSPETIAAEQVLVKKQTASRWARIDKRAFDAKSVGKQEVNTAIATLDGVPARGELFDRLLDTVLPPSERTWWSVSPELVDKVRTQSENAWRRFSAGRHEVVAEAIYARLWIESDDTGLEMTPKRKTKKVLRAPGASERKSLPIIDTETQEQLQLLVRHLLEQHHVRMQFKHSKVAEKIRERNLKRTEARHNSATNRTKIPSRDPQLIQADKQIEDGWEFGG